MTTFKAAVTAGVLKPGDALPSIRQLANDLELNSKTIAKAYKLLERDSIIEAKGYRGTYVHPKAKANWPASSGTCDCRQRASPPDAWSSSIRVSTSVAPDSAF